MNRNKNTLKAWDKLALSYQKKFMEVNLYNTTYDDFCDKIVKNDATILELGCGPGNITKHLQNKRPNYKILATDVSPSMIELGKINVPEASFQLLDVRDISDLNQCFDAILGGFVIPYLTPQETKKFITDSFQILNNKGILYFSCIEKEKNYSEKQTSSDGQFTMEVNYYQASYLLELLEKNQFKTLTISRINYQKTENNFDVHLILMAQKNK